MAELFVQIVDGLLVVGNLLLLGIDFRGEFVDVLARVLLQEGLIRVGVILHLILPELLLQHVEFALVGIELVLQCAQVRAEILLIVSFRVLARCLSERVLAISFRLMPLATSSLGAAILSLVNTFAGLAPWPSVL